MSEMLTDEACHVAKEMKFISAAEFMDTDTSGNVMLHNTMRFDVQLSHIQPMLDDGAVDKSELIEAIRKRIVEAVDDVVGKGLDGYSVLGDPMVKPVVRSKMLHRETIHFDLS